METIIGISAYYHDSAAVLIVNGKIIAAAQEERFTRIKHDLSFPSNAVSYILKEAGLVGSDISYVAFYEKPFLKFERIVEVIHSFAPFGFVNFKESIPAWIKDKLYLKRNLQKELAALGINTNILFLEHHLSHAASAFYPSPFKEAAIITIDGVGEWTTTSISVGKGAKISVLKELKFPHSLGLFYSAVTYYCGFRVNSGEYKLMGLAPYGIKENSNKYKSLLFSNIIDVKEDGSFLLNMDFFNYTRGLTMTNDNKWERLLGIPRRLPESELCQCYMDLALAAQDLIEEIILKIVQTAKSLTGSSNLVLAGGVALNCVANSKILNSNIFDKIFIQPASSDAGGALGAALGAWYIYLENKREIVYPDAMSGCYLGPSFTNKEVKNFITKVGANAVELDDDSLLRGVAKLISEGKIVGWFQGRMEFGPRALGNRSILADPCSANMQKKLNLKIKYRESFRPFAPSVLEEELSDYYEISLNSPYMLLVSKMKKNFLEELPNGYSSFNYMEKLYTKRSKFQAVVHVDFSSRVQSVSEKTNPKFHKLLNEFKRISGYGILVNTSFNVRGEPIVCSIEDAYNCFMSTEMDFLVVENWIFDKRMQNVRYDVCKRYMID